jgi:hypothetical protein
VDVEDIPEAESLCGRRLCRYVTSTGGGQCRNLAVEVSDPPRCINHGMAPGGHGSQAAHTRSIDNKAADRLAEIMEANGARLLDPRMIGNPLDELMMLASEIGEGKEILRHMVSTMYKEGKIRYIHGQAGEQIRVELLLYERALERFATILINISKLKIDERLAGIRKQTADMLERAIEAAFEESGVPLDNKQAVREAFRRQLRVVA